MSEALAVTLQYLTPKKALTQFAGFVAGGRWGAMTQWIIRDFISRYNVNMAEAAQPEPTSYATFNEFFSRALRPSSPIAVLSQSSAWTVSISPAS